MSREYIFCEVCGADFPNVELECAKQEIGSLQRKLSEVKTERDELLAKIASVSPWKLPEFGREGSATCQWCGASLTEITLKRATHGEDCVYAKAKGE